MASAPKTKIFVGHLPDGCQTEDLQALFEKHGVVKECDVINKYGFVHMSNAEEVEAAIKSLNNFNFNGSVISVELSKSKLHLQPGSSGRTKPRSDRNGYGPSRNSSYSNGFRSNPYKDSSRDAYYDRPFGLGGDRHRPYPSPYDRQSPPSYDQRSSPAGLHDYYMRRLPPPGTTDPYVRSSDLYARPGGPFTRASESYARSSDPYARASDPYARASDPYARASDPYARASDPYARTSDPYARASDPYARASDPYARFSDLYARPIPSLTSRDDMYDRRSVLDRNDYLYSRRSPFSRSYWYGDSLDSFRSLSTTAATRRSTIYY